MEFKDYAFQELDKACSWWDWYLDELKENKVLSKKENITSRDCAEYWISQMAKRVLIPENVEKIDPKEILNEYLMLKGE